MLLAAILRDPFICISDAPAINVLQWCPAVRLCSQAGLVLHVLGSLTQGMPRVARRCGGRWGQAPWAPVRSAALPTLSDMASGASGDVRQPRKPFVTLNRFDNVPISFNVTYPCVCASVIERDIGQI